jgi:hypothetical protein
MPLIYHITNYRNLPGIIQSGGLFSDNKCSGENLQYTNIGHSHIKQRRSDRRIPCRPGVNVGDCVPFYFGNRSPMLYSIHGGYVEGYQNRQQDVIYLVSSTECVAQSSVEWCFTDGNAATGITKFYTDMTILDQLNWEYIDARIWKDNDSHPDRKRQKQSEFLVYHFFPWSLVQSIGVYNQDMLSCIQNLFNQNNCIIPVSVETTWYY